MSRLQVSTPQNSSIGALRYIANKYSLTVDYGYPTGEAVGGWTVESTMWIYSGKEDWAEIQTELTAIGFSSETI